jgi:hypothetical protein
MVKNVMTDFTYDHRANRVQIPKVSRELQQRCMSRIILIDRMLFAHIYFRPPYIKCDWEINIIEIARLDKFIFARYDDC